MISYIFLRLGDIIIRINISCVSTLRHDRAVLGRTYGIFLSKRPSTLVTFNSIHVKLKKIIIPNEIVFV